MRRQRHVRPLIAALVVIVAGVAFWGILESKRRTYAAEWLKKAWPESAPQFQVAAQETRSGPQLLLLGDSRIAFWGLPSIPGWRVINAGVYGLTSSELVLIAPQVLRTYQPNVVVIQAGVNELKILGVRDDLYAALVTQCHSNLIGVAKLAEAQGAKVILTPVWPTGPVSWQRSWVWNERVSRAIEEVNRRLRSTLQGLSNIRVYDHFQSLGILSSPHSFDHLFLDTLHFTPEFYQQLTTNLLLELNRSSSQSVSEPLPLNPKPRPVRF